MKIITVIPLARGVFKENLTYFTASPVALGEVVTVPLRNKKISALVVGSENLASSKSTIKRSAFSLKKADQISGRAALPPGFIKAAYKLRSYAASTAPAVLAALLPKIYLENIDKLDERPEEPEVEKRGIRPEKLILQTSADERISYYKTYIREAFAKKKSVFIAVPTILDAEFFERSLSKGVENYTFVFHNDIPKKEFIKKFDKLAGESHPVLIIGTPPYLFLLNRKFEAVIVEEESRSAYKMPVRPYLDMRTWAEILSAEYGVKIIFGDEMLRLETLWRAKNYELTEIMPPSYRVGTGAKKELVDMKTDKKFAVLSEELKKKIAEAGQAGSKTFLFASRKGVAGATVCGDCGERVSCKDCDKPLTLHGEESKRFFMCHFCRDKSDALMTCKNCGSWNLKALGVGTDRVAGEIVKEFPKRPVFMLDRRMPEAPRRRGRLPRSSTRLRAQY